MEAEISPEEYATMRAELHDPQSSLRVQVEASDRDDHEVAELAIKAFELSQSPQERWLTAHYNTKRKILSIMLETVRLNSANIEFSLENHSIFCATKISSRSLEPAGHR